jgi:hypothetical protein
VSNFEQTIAVLCAVLIITGGLRCPDLTQRHQAVLGLVALCVYRYVGGDLLTLQSEQNGTAPRLRSFQAGAITAPSRAYR